MLKTNNTNTNFEDFIRISFERAAQRFHQTDQCKLLVSNSKKAQQDLKNKFNVDDYAYIEHCFEIMMQLEWREMEFLYRQAYKDCIELLRKLEILK